MKLIPASGSPRIQRALAHRYVHTIASILLHNYELLPPVSFLLRKYDRRTPTGLDEDLKSLCINQSTITDSGAVIIPPTVIELVQVLSSFYWQSDEDIRYQRGAILEVLVYKLVSPRYQSDECLGNQRFMDEHGRPITDQIDVAALSHSHRQLEGYECKLKVDGIESSDCTNLACLATASIERDYFFNVGMVSFDHQTYMRRKLQRLHPDPAIKLYGLDDITKLAHISFEAK